MLAFCLFFGHSKTKACTWHVSVIIWIIIHYACRLSDVLWCLVNTNWVISVPWLSAERQSVHLYPAHCLMAAAGSWTWLSKHKITALSVWLLRFLRWRLGDVSYRLCIPYSVNESLFLSAVEKSDETEILKLTNEANNMFPCRIWIWDIGNRGI